MHSQINEEVIGLVFSFCPNIHTLALKDCPTIRVESVASFLDTLPESIVLPDFNKLLLQNDVHIASSIVVADLGSLNAIRSVVGRLTRRKNAKLCDLEDCSKCERYFASSTEPCAVCGTASKALCLVCQRFCDGCYTQYCSSCIVGRCVSAMCRCTLKDQSTICYCAKCRAKYSCRRCQRMLCEGWSSLFSL